jgi:hypothetical protein
VCLFREDAMTVLLENVVALHQVSSGADSAAPALKRVTLIAICADGRLAIRDELGAEALCDWLESGPPPVPPLALGEVVLALLGGTSETGLVLGRVGRYEPSRTTSNVTIEATESLTLKCGEASVDLRADGKVMVRGEDVLLRAKGTQRIRAGNVSIN